MRCRPSRSRRSSTFPPWRACRTARRRCSDSPTCAARSCRSSACARCSVRADASAGAATKAIVLDVGARSRWPSTRSRRWSPSRRTRIETRQAELARGAGELLSRRLSLGAARRRREDSRHRAAARRRLRAAAAGRSGSRAAAAAGGRQTTADARDAAASKMLVTFDVAGQEFALELDAVQEILRRRPRGARAARGGAGPRRDVASRPAAAAAVAARPARLSAGAGCRRTREGRRHEGRRRPGRARGRPRANILAAAAVARSTRSRRCWRRAPAAKRASKRSIAATAAAGWCRSLPGATVPGGRHAAAGEGGAGRNAAREPRTRRGSARTDSSWCSAWATTSSACRSRPSTRSARCRQKITRLPKTPKFLEGVVNLRGDVLPVVDQRRRFDMPAPTTPSAAGWSSSEPNATARA